MGNYIIQPDPDLTESEYDSDEMYDGADDFDELYGSGEDDDLLGLGDDDDDDDDEAAEA